MTELKTNRYFSCWCAFLLGAPVWWILGLNLILYQTVAILFSFSLVYESGYRGRGIYFPGSFFLLAAVVWVYSFSLAIHAGEARDGSRVFASLYNLSFWFMGCGMVLVLANNFSLKNLPRVGNLFLKLALVIAVLTFLSVGMILGGSRSFIFQTPLSFMVPHAFLQADLVNNTLKVYLFFYDWFASSTFPRVSFLTPFPTATGGVVMVVLGMFFVRSFSGKKIVTMFYGFLFLICFAALVMTLSRTAIVGFFAGTFTVLILRKEKPLLWMFILVLVAVFFLPFFEQFLEWGLSLRKGSNEGRLSIYLSSFEQLQGMDWILGMGMKPRNEITSLYPIGSHSTYVTLLFKSGVIGLAIFILFQVSLLLRWYGCKSFLSTPDLFRFWSALGIVFIGMNIWMLTDDLDAPQILAFIYFSLVGIFEAFRRNLLSQSVHVVEAREEKT